MKTITEFAGSSLQSALKTRQELLGAGKTAEELPAAMGETLKLEGDKLALLLSALEVVEKKPRDLKRVVVWSLQEGEKPPRGTEQKGEHHFGVEYFPPMPGREPRDKHGKGRGDRGRDRKRGRRPGRGGGRDGRGAGRDGARTLQAGGGAGGAKPAGEGPGVAPGAAGDDDRKRRRRRRGPHGPRNEAAAPSATSGITPKKTGVITPRAGAIIPREPKEPAPSAASPEGTESGKESS